MVLKALEQGSGIGEAVLAAEDADDNREDGSTSADAGGEEAGVAEGAAGPVEDGEGSVGVAVELEALDDGEEVGEEGFEGGIGVGGRGEGAEEVVEVGGRVGRGVDEGVEGAVAAEGGAGVDGPRAATVGVVGPTEARLAGGGGRGAAAAVAEGGGRKSGVLGG